MRLVVRWTLIALGLGIILVDTLLNGHKTHT